MTNTYIHPLHPILVCSGKDPIFGYMASLEMAQEMISLHRVQMLFKSRPVSAPEIFNTMLNRFHGSYPSGLSREDMMEILDTLLDYGLINRELAGLNRMLTDFVELIEMRIELFESV